MFLSHVSLLRVKPKLFSYGLYVQLCADGYDVSNLISAEPAVRRRGFKLEYFLRPPVQVGRLIFATVFLCWMFYRGLCLHLI